ncbi:MAG: protein YgfX [Candidatus Porifericomitaceae bacterium WSBS_2022_MAG_OTU9]
MKPPPKWRAPLLLPIAAGRGLTLLRLVCLLPGVVCLLLLLPEFGYGVVLCGLSLLFMSAVQVCRLAVAAGQVMLDGNGAWWLLDGAGGRYELALAGSACVHPWCTVLPFSGAGRRFTLVLLPGSVAADVARVLRVRLRWDRA